MSQQPADGMSVDPGLRTARELALGGLLGALGLVLPLAFHMVPQGGPMFLPMHLPILVLGLLVRPTIAGTVGVIVPLLSFLLTGMPPVPTVVFMCLELGTLGAVASLLSRLMRRSPLAAPWAATLGAIIAARAMAGVAVMTVGPLMGFRRPVIEYLGFVIVTGLPGIIIQLTVVPLLITYLKRVGVIGQVGT